MRAQQGKRARTGGLRRVLALACAALLLASAGTGVPTADAQDPEPDLKYQYYFLIDASGSMVGLPQGSGNTVIFPQVKENVNALIDSLEPGAEVIIAPFHRGVQEGLILEREIRGDTEKSELKAHVNSLDADGQVTWIYHSLDYLLRMMDEARSAEPDVRHVQTIYLFTDGEDNSPAGVGLADILELFRLQRSDNPYLFLKYITLGTTSDPVWSREDGVEVQDNPTGEVLEILTVRLSPLELDFGNVRESGRAMRRLTIAYDTRLEGTEVAVSASSESMDVMGVTPVIQPDVFVLPSDGSGEVRQELTLSIENLDALLAAEEFEYSGEIRFEISDPRGDVDFAPDLIRFQMSLEPISAITLARTDSESLLTDLGKVDPYTSDYRPASVPLAATFNDRALAFESEVTLRLEGSGGVPDWVFFESPDGEMSDTLLLTGSQLEGRLVVDPPQGAEAGAYDLRVVVSSPDARLEGDGLEGGGDSAEPTHFRIAFSVADAPLPAWQRVVRWGIAAVIALLVAAVVAVLLVALKTGSTPLRVLALMGRKGRPRLMDARLQVLSPDVANPSIDMTGQKVFRVGTGTSSLADMPAMLVFTPRVSVLDAEEGLEVEMVVSGDTNGVGSVMTVTHPATGDVRYGNTSRLRNGDRIRVETGREVHEVEFSSTYKHYRDY